MDLLRLLGMAGGGVAIVMSVVFFFLIPTICEPGSSPDVLVGFNCLGQGVLSQVQWALLLGGASGGVAALLAWAWKSNGRG